QIRPPLPPRLAATRGTEQGRRASRCLAADTSVGSVRTNPGGTGRVQPLTVVSWERHEATLYSIGWLPCCGTTVPGGSVESQVFPQRHRDAASGGRRARRRLYRHELL